MGVPINMVDEKQVRKVLPKALVTYDPKYKLPFYEYESKKRMLRKIERTKPSLFEPLFRSTVKVYEEWEKLLEDWKKLCKG